MALHYWKSLLILGLFLGFGAKGLEQEDLENEEYDYYDEDYDKAKEEKMRGLKPKILSEPVTVTLRKGDNTELFCETEDAEEFVIMWKLAEKMLFMIMSPTTRMNVTRDDRITLHGQTLKIRDIQPEHMGNFTCEISSQPEVSLVHEVNVLYPATAAGKKKEVKLGQPAVIQCDVTGNPKPKITWTRQGKRMPSGEHTVEGESITLPSSKARDAGVYQCVVDNGLGEPASAKVQLDVVYAPMIQTEKSFVHQESGSMEAELTCIVKAFPTAIVVWYKNGAILNVSVSESHMTIKQVKNRHTLKIENFQDKDFGTYNCRASNKIGRSTGNIKLEGVASPAIVLDMNVEDKVYNIVWQVQSLSSIQMYKLMYRQVQASDPNVWTEVAVVPTDNSEGFIYKGSYKLKGLHSYTTYEAKVLSKNPYGWSKESEMYQFTTKETDNIDPEPEPSDAAPQPSDTMGDMSAGPQPSDSKTKKEAQEPSAEEIGVGNKENQASSSHPYTIAIFTFVSAVVCFL